MLLQLYNYFENLLIRTVEDLRHIELRNLGVFKSVILTIMVGLSLFGLWYSVQSFSSYSQSLIEFLYDSKNFGFYNITRFITRSFGEIKFSLSLLIAILLAFNLIYNQYINRANGMIFDIIYIPLENYEDNDANADLNRNDRQNVHNGAISKYVKEAVKKLTDNEKKEQIKQQSWSEIYNEIRQYLIDSSHPSSDVALDVLNQMHNMNAFHVATNSNEMEVLRMVWQRIKHPVNINIINDLKESLLTQLADCKPNGNIMCVTGRITRILQTLECIDAENIVNLKPMWAIKENIAEYFGHYADKLLDKVPNHYKTAFEKIKRNPEEEQLMEKFNQCLIKNLNNKFKMIYLDTNILNQKQLDELSKEYFENIANI